MKVLFYSEFDDPQDWRQALQALDANVEVVSALDADNSDPEIKLALLYLPPSGLLEEFRSLRALHSLAAGVEPLLAPGATPQHLPIVRMMDATLAETMVEFCLLSVLYAHRDFAYYQESQSQSQWSPRVPRPSAGLPVTVLGLGYIGAAVARRLAAYGLDVVGWSRTPKSIEGVASAWGDQSLRDVIARAHVLVSVLPLTPLTRGLLGKERLGSLRLGAHFINVGRGECVVEDDLMSLLEHGHIASAILDNFAIEPLPSAHPLWRTRGVKVTPHIAGYPSTSSAALHVLQTIRWLRGDANAPSGIVDRARGY